MNCIYSDIFWHLYTITREFVPLYLKPIYIYMIQQHYKNKVQKKVPPEPNTTLHHTETGSNTDQDIGSRCLSATVRQLHV